MIDYEKLKLAHALAEKARPDQMQKMRRILQMIHMMVINKPDDLIEVQCYKCKTIIKTHPMSNMHSDYFKDCQTHIKECPHEAQSTGGEQFEYQTCRLCGEHYK